MAKLCEACNIGKVLELKLKSVGIENLEDLKGIGVEEAFIKIKQIDKNAGRSILFSIDGAILGVKWHELPDNRKNELRNFFDQIEARN